MLHLRQFSANRQLEASGSERRRKYSKLAVHGGAPIAVEGGVKSASGSLSRRPRALTHQQERPTPFQNGQAEERFGQFEVEHALARLERRSTFGSVPRIQTSKSD